MKMGQIERGKDAKMSLSEVPLPFVQTLLVIEQNLIKDKED